MKKSKKSSITYFLVSSLALLSLIASKKGSELSDKKGLPSNYTLATQVCTISSTSPNIDYY